MQPLGEHNGRHEQRRFNIPKIGEGVLQKRLLSVFENRRDVNEAQVCAVGAREVMSLDWIHSSGKALGGRLLGKLCNDDSVLMGSRVVDTEAIEQIMPLLEEVGARPNVKARVLMIDKVPVTMAEDALSKLERMIMLAIPSIEYVLQDNFHVTHNISLEFNNMSPLFYSFGIHGFRMASKLLDAQCEARVDEALKAGLVQKTRKGRSIKLGDKLTNQKIFEMKQSGVYHDFFSASPDVVVPELVKSAAALDLAIPAWAEMIVEHCFEPADEDGVRRPKFLNKQKFAASAELVYKVAKNALKRMKKCIPPVDMPAWEDSGETDQNNFIIWKPRFHTCGVESDNARDKNVASAGQGQLLGTGRFLELNTKSIITKAVKLGQQEDLGTWDVRAAVAINELSGHGAGGVPLMMRQPLKVTMPPPKPEGVIVIQDVGRLDSAASKQVITHAELRQQAGAPVVSYQLPPTLALTMPQLAATAAADTATLLESRTLQLQSASSALVAVGAEEEEEEAGASQCDSPITQRRMRDVGVDDAEKASPGSLKRAWTAISSFFGASDKQPKRQHAIASTTVAPSPSATAVAPSPSAAAVAEPPPPRPPLLPSAEAVARVAKLFEMDEATLSALAGDVNDDGECLRGLSGPDFRLVMARRREMREAASAERHGGRSSLGGSSGSSSAPPPPGGSSGSSSMPPPPPPPLPPPPPPTAASLPLVLLQPSAHKTADAAASAKSAKAKMERNKWRCTCLPDPEIRGPKHHEAACARMTFERNGVDPKIGEISICMGCAGPRAGQAWRCDRLHRKGWTRVPESDKVLSLGIGQG